MNKNCLTPYWRFERHREERNKGEEKEKKEKVKNVMEKKQIDKIREG